MITLKEAEDFLYSKLALFVGMLMVICGLLYDRTTLTADISTLKKEKADAEIVHKSEIAEYQEREYNRQQQDKMDAENALQAEKYRTQKYEDAVFRIKEVEAAAKKHYIIN